MRVSGEFLEALIMENMRKEEKKKDFKRINIMHFLLLIT
jgi:hypothetical protein